MLNTGRHSGYDGGATDLHIARRVSRMVDTREPEMGTEGAMTSLQLITNVCHQILCLCNADSRCLSQKVFTTVC
jgi:hypothetical protein